MHMLKTHTITDHQNKMFTISVSFMENCGKCLHLGQYHLVALSTSGGKGGTTIHCHFSLLKPTIEKCRTFASTRLLVTQRYQCTEPAIKHPSAAP